MKIQNIFKHALKQNITYLRKGIWEGLRSNVTFVRGGAELGKYMI